MTRLASPGETEKFRDRRGGYVINPASQPYLPKSESILARCKFCLGVPNISKYFSMLEIIDRYQCTPRPYWWPKDMVSLSRQLVSE